MSDEDKMNRDYRNNKKGWINKTDFYHYSGRGYSNRRFGKQPAAYVFNSPYQPPADFKYREIEKVKWVDPKNYFKNL
jgi:hypothetical protein